MRELSELLAEAVAKNGESPRSASMRIFSGARMVQSYLSHEARISAKAFAKLVKGFNIRRDKALLQQWMLAFVWEVLDMDGRRIYEDSKLDELIAWGVDCTPAPMAEKVPHLVGKTEGSVVRRTAVLHCISQHNAACSIDYVASKTKLASSTVRHAILALHESGYLRRKKRGPVELTVPQWMLTVKGATYDKTYGEKLAPLLSEHYK